MQPQLFTVGTFQTPNGSKFIAQLCKHFGHKIETSYDDVSGKISFGFGPCTLKATDETLEITVSAPDQDGLKSGQKIIDSHLKRFAFREEFEAMNWQ